jgi:hypothetical protein
MTRSLKKRLKSLEDRIPPPPTRGAEVGIPISSFLMLAAAYYFGDPGADEPLVIPLARALGYAGPFEFQKAAENEHSDFAAKGARAMAKVLAKFGVSADSKPPALADAFDQIAAGMSQSFKERLKSILDDISWDWLKCELTSSNEAQR